MKKYVLVLLLCLLTLFICFLPRQAALSDSAVGTDSFIKALMREAAIPGLAVAKINAGELVYRQTFGYANIAQNILVRDNTMFNIASISKPVMGLILLQLVQQKQLALDEDINSYLPFKLDNPHTEGEVITLRHLASHSSAIADYYDLSSYAENKDADISLHAHLLALLTPGGSKYGQGQYFLAQMPGEARTYSNLAAGLAGYLVEATTGVSLAQYSKATLFGPLGMHHTSWLIGDINLAKVAVPYEVEQCVPYLPVCADTESARLNQLIGHYINPDYAFKHFRPYPHFGNPQYPDGGMRSSIHDMSVLLTAVLRNTNLHGEPLLSDALYQEMLALQLPDVSQSQRFFWRDNSKGWTGHMGSDLGVFTALYFDHASGDGFIILMNRSADASTEVAMKKLADRLMAL